MEYRVEIGPRAQAEAFQAYWRIAEDSSTRADRWYEGLFNKIETLKSFPKRCPKAWESGAFGPELREMLYGKRGNKYRVLFSIRGDTIRVISVWHSARGPFIP